MELNVIFVIFNEFTQKNSVLSICTFSLYPLSYVSFASSALVHYLMTSVRLTLAGVGGGNFASVHPWVSPHALKSWRFFVFCILCTPYLNIKRKSSDWKRTILFAKCMMDCCVQGSTCCTPRRTCMLRQR